MTDNVLLVGGGGREHALAWKLAESPRVGKVFVAPGNGGTAAAGGKIENVAISADAFDDLIEFAAGNDVGLTVVGPCNVINFLMRLSSTVDPTLHYLYTIKICTVSIFQR